jgi:hypothetical protein
MRRKVPAKTENYRAVKGNTRNTRALAVAYILWENMNRNSITMLLVILMVLSIGIIMAGCATTPAVTDIPVPGQNESLIIIQRKNSFIGSAVTMKVWVDGLQLASTIRNGREIMFIVADGEHTMQGGRGGGTRSEMGPLVTFSAIGEEITFFAEVHVTMLTSGFKLTQTGRRKL